MRKLILVIVAGVVSTVTLLGQEELSPLYPDPPSVIARISLTIPGLILELAPSEYFTFTTTLWILPTFHRTDAEGVRQSRPFPYLNPRITLEPRYYFNLWSRTDRGRRTDYYSGWYVGIPFTLVFSDLRYSMATTIGFQRTLGRRWYWNVGAGPGFSYRDHQFKMHPGFDLGLGIILNH